jgi:hypothetical protein
MDTMARRTARPTGLRRARTMYWLISRHHHGRLDVLVARIGGGKALPVFSMKEEAEAFLCAYATDGWEVRETGVGELVSLLSDPYRDAKHVVLDPPPDAMDESVFGLVTVGRQVFMESLLGMGRGWFDDTRLREGVGRARDTA